MKWLKTLVLVLVLLTLGVFAALFQNQQEIVLRFAIWQTPFTLSVFWWLLAALVIGVMLGMLAGLWAGLKRRMENRRLRQSLARAEAELDRLRDLSIQG